MVLRSLDDDSLVGQLVPESKINKKYVYRKERTYFRYWIEIYSMSCIVCWLVKQQPRFLRLVQVMVIWYSQALKIF